MINSSGLLSLSSGGIDRVHRTLYANLGLDRVPDHGLELVFRASNDLDLFRKISYKTLQLVQESQSFDGNPIYAVLHEPIYCQG